MLSNVGIGQEFWTEAVETICYLVNQSPTTKFVDKTPQEVWIGKKHSIKHLQVFSCDAYVHVPREKRRKFDKKYEKCIFITYKYGMKGYKIWNLVTKKTFIVDMLCLER